MTERTSHLAGLCIGAAISNTSHSNKACSTLSNEHGSQVKDQGRRQCCHNKHKKFLYRPTRDVFYFRATPPTSTYWPFMITLLFQWMLYNVLSYGGLFWKGQWQVVLQKKRRISCSYWHEWNKYTGKWRWRSSTFSTLCFLLFLFRPPSVPLL